MFNLQSEVQRLQQLKRAKVYGISYKRKPNDPKVEHVDEQVLEQQAIQEGTSIPRSFHNHSLGFGRRLRKSKGEYHRPGGGFAGNIT